MNDTVDRQIKRHFKTSETRAKNLPVNLIKIVSFLAVMTMVVFASVNTAKAAQPLSVFGAKEIFNKNTKPFPKWRDMLMRFGEERLEKDSLCSNDRYNFCFYEDWRVVLAALKDKTPYEQMTSVNELFNGSPYITDDFNWSVNDYWETPGQFLSRYGDCEDFAIVKYFTLKQLGFDPASMRVVVLKDENLKVHHAVLIVEIDGKLMVLDNQIKSTINAEKINHYRPVYSINETGWWLHRS